MSSYGDDFYAKDVTAVGKITGAEVVATTFCMGGVTTAIGSSAAYTPNAPASGTPTRELIAGTGTVSIANNNTILRFLIEDLKAAGILG